MRHLWLLGLCGVAFGARLSADVVIEAGRTREQLQTMASYRQQHRKTEDGRLCAAAFVQNRQSYTGCTAALGLVAAGAQLASMSFLVRVFACVSCVHGRASLFFVRVSRLCVSWRRGAKPRRRIGKGVVLRGITGFVD